MKFVLYFVPRLVFKYLMSGVLILTGLSLAVQISTYGFHFYEEWMDMLNLDMEMNLPTWYSAFMLAFCAILLTVIAAGKQTQSDRYTVYWRRLSYIFWLLSIDEVFSFHEVLIIPEVAEALKLPWFLHSMWVIPGTILVGLFIRYFWRFFVHLPTRLRGHFFLAFFFYIGGALGMEMVGSHYAEWQTQRDLIYALIAIIEEVMELSGIVIFIYGLLSYLGSWLPEWQIEVKIPGDFSRSSRNKK